MPPPLLSPPPEPASDAAFAASFFSDGATVELLLRIARRADELAREHGATGVLGREWWLRAEAEVLRKAAFTRQSAFSQ